MYRMSLQECRRSLYPHHPRTRTRTPSVALLLLLDSFSLSSCAGGPCWHRVFVDVFLSDVEARVEGHAVCLLFVVAQGTVADRDGVVDVLLRLERHVPECDLRVCRCR